MPGPWSDSLLVTDAAAHKFVSAVLAVVVVPIIAEEILLWRSGTL